MVLQSLGRAITPNRIKRTAMAFLCACLAVMASLKLVKRLSLKLHLTPLSLVNPVLTLHLSCCLSVPVSQISIRPILQMDSLRLHVFPLMDKVTSLDVSPSSLRIIWGFKIKVLVQTKLLCLAATFYMKARLLVPWTLAEPTTLH